MKFIRLDDICEILNGYAFKSSNYVKDGIRIIRITNVQKGFIEDSDPQYYPEEKLYEIERFMLRDGDLLISLTGNVGRVAVLSKDMLPAALNQRVACLRVKRNDLIYKPFLFQLLNSDYFEKQCILASKGIAQKNMSTEWLKEYSIPLFSMEFQKKTSLIFDKIDSIIACRKKQSLILDQFVKSRFIEIFGDPENNNKAWKVKFLDNLCTVGSSKRVYQSEQSSEGVPFWRISDLVSKIDTGTVDSALFISKTKYTELKQAGLVPVTGDILLTSRGTLGRCYIIKDEDRFYFQDGMISWLSNYSEEITPLYLQYLFSMSGFRQQIDKLQAGSTVAYLSIAMLKKLQVMVPDKTLQKQFAAFVTQVDKSKYYSYYLNYEQKNMIKIKVREKPAIPSQTEGAQNDQF